METKYYIQFSANPDMNVWYDIMFEDTPEAALDWIMRSGNDGAHYRLVKKTSEVLVTFLDMNKGEVPATLEKEEATLEPA